MNIFFATLLRSVVQYFLDQIPNVLLQTSKIIKITNELQATTTFKVTFCSKADLIFSPPRAMLEDSHPNRDQRDMREYNVAAFAFQGGAAEITNKAGDEMPKYRHSDITHYLPHLKLLLYIYILYNIHIYNLY